MTDPRIKQIRIKTGILKRSVKEKESYEKELEQEKKRLETMKQDNKDIHDINKQNEVINETVMLLPDCQKRINVAFDDLQKIVKEAQFDLHEDEIFKNAQTLLKEVNISA